MLSPAAKSFTGLLRWPRGVSHRECGALRRPRLLDALGWLAARGREREMSNGVFVAALAGSAAALAMWIHVRFPSLAPEQLGRTMLHAAAAFLLLKVAAALGGGATAFVAIFVFLLPALVYALLCTLWVLLAAQAAFGLRR